MYVVAEAKVVQSGPIFKEMLRLLKYKTQSQLMSFLRKLKKLLSGEETKHTVCACVY